MANKDRRIYIMAEERPVKAVLHMGLPVTAGMMVMVIYNLTDTFFIGMLDDDYQLAATNLAYPVMMVLIALSAIVASGAASYISRCIGAGRMDRAERTLTMGFELVIDGSIVIAAAGLIFTGPIVRVLGADETTAGFTAEYVRILFAGTFCIMGSYTFGQLLRSEGSVMPSMAGLMAGTVANILLDPLMIFGLHMGIGGAAAATVLGNGIGTAIFIWYYASGRTLLRPDLKRISADPGIFREILWVGLPHTLEQFMTTAAMVVLNNLAAGYGGLAVAAMGISLKLMSFGTYIYQGMTAGCQPILGYCFGAKDHARLRQIIIAGIGVSTCFELGVMAVFGAGAPGLVGLFTESPEVIALGTQTLRAMMLILPFVCATSVARNTYTAMGMPMHSFGITVVRQMVLYVPFMLLLNRVWGYAGLVHAQPCSELICMVLSLWMLLGTVRKLKDDRSTCETKTVIS